MTGPARARARPAGARVTKGARVERKATSSSRMMKIAESSCTCPAVRLPAACWSTSSGSGPVRCTVRPGGDVGEGGAHRGDRAGPVVSAALGGRGEGDHRRAGLAVGRHRGILHPGHQGEPAHLVLHPVEGGLVGRVQRAALAHGQDGPALGPVGQERRGQLLGDHARRGGREEGGVVVADDAAERGEEGDRGRRHHQPPGHHRPAVAHREPPDGRPGALGRGVGSAHPRGGVGRRPHRPGGGVAANSASPSAKAVVARNPSSSRARRGDATTWRTSPIRHCPVTTGGGPGRPRVSHSVEASSAIVRG